MAHARGTRNRPPEPGPGLSPGEASRYARITLGCVRREYPAKMDHVLLGPEDLLSPRSLHPAFHGCFDWHSAVHGHWMLARLLRAFPDLPEAPAIRALLDEHLAPDPIAAEVAYFHRPGQLGFERTYGWAWLLKLAAELMAAPAARNWSAALRPLAEVVAGRFRAFLPRLACPVRSGVHPNTAFSLSLALDYARAGGDGDLEQLLTRRARGYYLRDRRAALASEPGGEDFLSPSLEAAALMGRILPAVSFRAWLTGYLPERMPGPVQVSDRSDPKLVHLDGLNLSRARALLEVARALGGHDPRRPALERAARRHAGAALPHVGSGDYGGDHWLATFAVRLLLED